jgi:hypothetical protein
MVDAALRQVPDPIVRLYAAAIRTSERRDVRRGALVLALLLAAAAFAYLMVNVYLGDSYGYWQTIRLDHLYYTADPDTAPHGYLYAPVFVQILLPLILLPWEVFHAIWLAAMIALLFWMSGRWVALLLFALFFAPFAIGLLAAPRHYLSSGNIFLPMALAVVAGFRWPWTYSFLLLTKVTPGIGLLWFLARAEWRNLFIALGATAAVALVSFSFSWTMWFDWFTVLRNNVGNPEPAFAIQLLPLIPRLAIAAAITLVGARYDARWVVPIAAMIALPYIPDTALIMVVGVLPLLRHDAWTEGRAGRSDAAAGATSPLPGP